MNAQEYAKLPYSVVVKRIEDESGCYYHATVLELDGCQSTGETFEEAHQQLLEAMEGWIETRLENGFSIPHPIENEKYSGRFVLRLPKSLHCQLAIAAQQEGVSLNQYALYKLSH